MAVHRIYAQPGVGLTVEDRSATLRRKLSGQMAELKEVLRNWEWKFPLKLSGQYDNKTQFIRRWLEHLQSAMRSYEVVEQVFEEALDALEEILKDPRQNPLTTKAILGEDGLTYSSEEECRGTPHELVAAMVKFLHDYRSPTAMHILEGEDFMAEAFGAAYARINQTYNRLKGECLALAARAADEREEIRARQIEAERQTQKLKERKQELQERLEGAQRRLTELEKEVVSLQVALNELQQKAHERNSIDLGGIAIMLGITAVSAIGSVVLKELGVALLPGVEGIQVVKTLPI